MLTCIYVAKYCFQMINNIMTTSFKNYFHGLQQESDITDLRDLLSQIDDAIRTAKETDTNDFEPRYVEFISKKVGELYDAITQQNLRLPADMQGDAGDKPQHLDTLNRLKGMVKAESTVNQLDYIINVLTEQKPVKRNKSPRMMQPFSQSSYDPMMRNKNRGQRHTPQRSTTTQTLEPLEIKEPAYKAKGNANPLATPAGSKVSGSYMKDARGAQNNPAAAALAKPAGSKIAGDFRADAQNTRNTPAPADTSIYTGAKPTSKPTPMDSTPVVAPEPKRFGRMDHRPGPARGGIVSGQKGLSKPVGTIPIGDVPGKIASGLKGLGKKLVGGGTPLSSKGRSRQMRGFASRR